MSSEGTDLKAGHPPAVKAGGMRVVSKHKPSEKVDADAYDQKYIDKLPQQASITAPIAGPAIPYKGHGDNTPEASKFKSHKPMPAVEKSHSPSKSMHINQPRK